MDKKPYGASLKTPPKTCEGVLEEYRSDNDLKIWLTAHAYNDTFQVGGIYRIDKYGIYNHVFYYSCPGKSSIAHVGGGEQLCYN